MSTRCNIHFTYGEEIVSNIYRHSDGYPEGVLPDLQTFFHAVLKDCDGYATRFDDPEYLAAKYLVWQAAQYGEGLAFSSVSPCLQDHGDIEYIYTVDCAMLDNDGFPSVSDHEA